MHLSANDPTSCGQPWSEQHQMSCQSEKKRPGALSRVWGKGNMSIVCYKADRAVRAHAVGSSSGADVRGGIVGPDFTLPSQSGEWVSLGNFLGTRPVVL